VLNVINGGREVVSSDDTVQVVAEMWDNNILTFLVSSKISKKVKKHDSVLVDYRPMSEKVPIPKHTVIKILKGKTATDIWKHYKKHFEQKQKTPQLPSIAPQYLG